jgi:hypothetical protein
MGPVQTKESIATLGLKKWMDDLSDLGTIMHAMKKQEGKAGKSWSPRRHGLQKCETEPDVWKLTGSLGAEAEKEHPIVLCICQLGNGTRHPHGDHFPKFAAADNTVLQNAIVING